MNARGLTPETDGLIRGIIRRELSGSSVASVEASVGEDHDGDESIIVEIIYDAPEPDVDPKHLARLTMIINKELYEAGEQRFAYIYNRASEDEPSFGSR